MPLAGTSTQERSAGEQESDSDQLLRNSPGSESLQTPSNWQNVSVDGQPPRFEDEVWSGESNVSSPTSSHMTWPALLTLSNRSNTCYAAAIIQVSYFVGLGAVIDKPDPGRLDLHQQLQAVLSAPAHGPPLTVIDVVAALNLCQSPTDQFEIGRQHCSIEFLEAMLSNVRLQNFFSEFSQQGHCSVCATTATNPGWGFSGHSNVLRIQFPDGHSQVDLEKEGKYFIWTSKVHSVFS